MSPDSMTKNLGLCIPTSISTYSLSVMNSICGSSKESDFKTNFSFAKCFRNGQKIVMIF